MNSHNEHPWLASPPTFVLAACKFHCKIVANINLAKNFTNTRRKNPPRTNTRASHPRFSVYFFRVHIFLSPNLYSGFLVQFCNIKATLKWESETASCVGALDNMQLAPRSNNFKVLHMLERRRSDREIHNMWTQVRESNPLRRVTKKNLLTICDWCGTNFMDFGRFMAIPSTHYHKVH